MLSTLLAALLGLSAVPLQAQPAPAQPPTEAPPGPVDPEAPPGPVDKAPPNEPPTEPPTDQPPAESPPEPPAEGAERSPSEDSAGGGGADKARQPGQASGTPSETPPGRAGEGTAGAAAVPAASDGTLPPGPGPDAEATDAETTNAETTNAETTPPTGAPPPAAARPEPAAAPGPATPGQAPPTKPTATEPNLSVTTHALPKGPDASGDAPEDAPPKPDDDTTRGIREHDGFMFELGLLGDFHLLHNGKDYVATTRDGEPLLGAADASGTSQGLSIALGGGNGALTAGGRLEFTVGTGGSILKVDGQRARLEEDDGIASLGLDGFLRWHLVHHLAVEVGAGLGLTIVSTDLAQRADDPDLVPGGGGLRVQAGLMKLFWLSDQWSTGIRVRTVLAGGSGVSFALGLGWLVIYQ